MGCLLVGIPAALVLAARRHYFVAALTALAAVGMAYIWSSPIR